MYLIYSSIFNTQKLEKKVQIFENKVINQHRLTRQILYINLLKLYPIHLNTLCARDEPNLIKLHHLFDAKWLSEHVHRTVN